MGVTFKGAVHVASKPGSTCVSVCMCCDNASAVHVASKPGSTCVSVCMCCDNASGVHVVIIQAVPVSLCACVVIMPVPCMLLVNQTVPVCLCACVVIMPVVCMSSSYRQYLCVCVHVL